MIRLVLLDNKDYGEIGVRRWPVCPQVNTHITYDSYPWCVISVVHGEWVEDEENPGEAIAEIFLYVEEL